MIKFRLNTNTAIKPHCDNEFFDLIFKTFPFQNVIVSHKLCDCSINFFLVFDTLYKVSNFLMKTLTKRSLISQLKSIAIFYVIYYYWRTDQQTICMHDTYSRLHFIMGKTNENDFGPKYLKTKHCNKLYLWILCEIFLTNKTNVVAVVGRYKWGLYKLSSKISRMKNSSSCICVQFYALIDDMYT